MLKEFLLVALGGACGSVARYSITLMCVALSVSSWIGTFVVNTVGALIIGLVISAFGKGDLNLLLAVGFCGGFTTFSTFSAQALDMFQNGRYALAFSYMLFSLLVCVLFVWLGVFLGKKLF